MIQRVQTLYLLISIIICIVLLYLPMGHLMLNEEATYFIYGFVSAVTGETLVHVYLTEIVFLVVLLLQMLSIFSYKNRLRQAMMAQVSLVLLVLLAVSVLMAPDLFGLIPLVEGNKINLEFNWNIILVAIPWVVTYLAIRSIKKDEALVRSADRMR